MKKFEEGKSTKNIKQIIAQAEKQGFFKNSWLIRGGKRGRKEKAHCYALFLIIGGDGGSYKK